jgi:hypothetical protein
MFIAAHKRAHHWSLFRARLIRSTFLSCFSKTRTALAAPVNQLLLLRSNLMLSSHLQLGLRNSFFPICFLRKRYMYSAPMPATWPTHLSVLDLIHPTVFDEE